MSEFTPVQVLELLPEEATVEITDIQGLTDHLKKVWPYVMSQMAMMGLKMEQAGDFHSGWEVVDRKGFIQQYHPTTPEQIMLDEAQYTGATWCERLTGMMYDALLPILKGIQLQRVSLDRVSLRESTGDWGETRTIEHVALQAVDVDHHTVIYDGTYGQIDPYMNRLAVVPEEEIAYYYGDEAVPMPYQSLTEPHFERCFFPNEDDYWRLFYLLQGKQYAGKLQEA